MAASTEPDWGRIRGVLSRVLGAPTEGREQQLQEECGDDTELRERVRFLLAADQDGTVFLEPTRESPTPEGQRIGPWRIDTLLGTGGMGSVWLAHRADGSYEQKVALKIARVGLASPDLLSRLERERALLARLEHPGIARLLDGGTTDDGAPYIAMEYVDGLPIDTHANKHRLDLGQRARLFVRVLDAVQYAHDKGVIHRDLKPANLFVKEDGTVKLLDFGIATLIEGEDGELGTLTRTGERLLTPRYASPEQISGAPVGKATDVYALGVMLFELLTGTTPYHSSGTSLAELESAICHDPPARASRAVATTTRSSMASNLDAIASERRSTTDRLRRDLEGELDWILTKALAKEPERRYATAALFREDLQRHIDGGTVLARPDSAAYRFRKFVARNRLAVTAVATIMLILTSATIVSLGLFLKANENERLASQKADDERIAKEQAKSEFSRAEQEKQNALDQTARAERRAFDQRNLLSTVLNDVAQKIADLPGATDAKVVIAQSALPYLESLIKDSPGDTALERQLALSCLRLAGTLFSNREANAGRFDLASPLGFKAREISERLLKEDPENLNNLYVFLASSLYVADLLFGSGQAEAAQALVEETSEYAVVLETLDNPSPRELSSWAFLLVRQCEYALRESRFDEAEKTASQGAEVAALMVEIDSGLVQGTLHCGSFARILGDVAKFQGRPQEAEEHFEVGVDIAYEFLDEYPQNAQVMNMAASLQADVALSRHLQGRFEDALESWSLAEELLLDLVDADSADILVRSELGRIYYQQARSFKKVDDVEGAREALEKSLELHGNILARGPQNRMTRTDLVNSLLEIAKLERDEGEFQRAATHTASAEQTLLATPGGRVPLDALVWWSLRVTQARLYLAWAEDSEIDEEQSLTYLKRASENFSRANQELEQLRRLPIPAAAYEPDVAGIQQDEELCREALMGS